MCAVVWGVTGGYRLRPWKSPYLRWRIETYWGLHAERITFVEFWHFVWKHRKELLRYARWADRMSRASGAGDRFPSPAHAWQTTESGGLPH